MGSFWWLLALAVPAAPVAPVPPAAVEPAPAPAPGVAPTPETPRTARAQASDTAHAAAARRFDVPANTLLELETTDPVSSAINHPGDVFSLRLSEPLRWGPTELLPAGTPVQGQVVHAARSKGGGKAGELILAARYAQTAQGRLKLRANFGASGKDHTKGALAASFALGPFAMAVHGSERVIAPGTRLSARLADPVTFHCGALAAPPSSPTQPTAPQGLSSQ
jgi:hypothetical protein